MIPEFPSFKKIELSDKNEIEEFVSNFPPYSAFNFTNLFAWDIRNDRGISKLNGNLVILLTDYETSEPFLTFIGVNKCEETIAKLLYFANESKISPNLRFITEESIKDIKSSDIIITEDRDNFDYIFSPNELAKFQGIKFKKHRHLARKFEKDNPSVVFELKDLTDLSVPEIVSSVLHQWECQKKAQNKCVDLRFEEKALYRLLDNVQNNNLILSCISVRNRIIGFSIDELLPNHSVMSHFIKADSSFKGIYEFFNQKLAQHFVTLNIELWNWQQDLNINNLRETKLGYRPVSFLKRYTVCYSEIHNDSKKIKVEDTNLLIQQITNIK